MSIIRAARQRASGLIVHHTLDTLSRINRHAPKARRALAEIDITRDVAYGPLPAHRLDVYRPRGEGPRPAVLYVHGGGFRILSKDSHWPLALRFAEQGFTVFSINYRLAPFPAGLVDLSHAWRWLQGAAAGFGARRPFILAGESAGANLSLALTLALCDPRPEPWAAHLFGAPRPDAVLPACGLLQASDTARFQRRKPGIPFWISDRLLQVSEGYLGRSTRAADLADPLLILESDARLAHPLPPIFAGVGTRDPILDDTRRLAVALARREATYEVLFYEGGVHAFQAFIWSEVAARFWADQRAFLARHLGV
ncbi:alpha/beta hydrolase [Myxococcota bacterium]|nr:alpha/beta hydrolase [Myxococcota bacterium]MBU1428962.1 alpha/beta hydrolase [Myxococcota bacterium]MBU1898471.1 alpha/beta hydrolase [Myxococcota bacterium]